MIDEQIKKPVSTTPIKPVTPVSPVKPATPVSPTFPTGKLSNVKVVDKKSSVPPINKPLPKVVKTPPIPSIPPISPKDKPSFAKATKSGPKKERKWMLWGLIGFTLILLATAVFLFLQIRKPEPEPELEPVLPTVKQTEPEPVLPTVKQIEPEGVCEIRFTVEASPSPSPSVSPSPSPPITCYDECETNVDCDGGLICDEVDGVDRCINYECPEESDCLCEDVSPSPSPSVSPSPTPSPPPTCYDECETNADCVGDLICDDVNGVNRCVNYECPEESDCLCEDVSPSLSPGASPTARGKQPELPEAGVSTPAVLGISVGILLVILGLLF